jgi:hypothetical protein
VACEYDTAERDLERAGMTLSRHSSEAGVDWRLTLPHGEQVEAWEPGNAGLVPPREITRFIRAIAARRNSSQIRRLATCRRTTTAGSRS